MVRIAVHLDRPERVRLHQHRDRARRKRVRRRKIHRLAQDQILGRLHIRKDRLIRLLGAPGEPGQSQRGAHHLQEAAPADRIHPLARACLPRELLFQHLVEARRLRQFVQVLPEALARLALQLRAHLGQRQPSLVAAPTSICHSVAQRRNLLFQRARRRNRGHQLSLRLHPVLACLLHRWHVSQLVISLGGRMWYCAVKKRPRSSWLVNLW